MVDWIKLDSVCFYPFWWILSIPEKKVSTTALVYCTWANGDNILKHTDVNNTENGFHFPVESFDFELYW